MITIIYFVVSLLLAVASFFVVNRGRGTLFALGVSLLALVVLGASFLALAAIIVRSM